MRVRKFYAKNLQEGLQLVKKDLGKDAIIIDSRTVREKGIKGFFKPRRLEILAALDRQVQEKEKSNNGDFSEKEKEKERQENHPARNSPLTGQDMHEGLHELKSMMHKLLLQNSGQLQNEQESETVACWKNHLENHDVNPELIEEIMEEIQVNLSGEVKLTRDVMAMVIEKKVAERMSYAEEKSSRLQVFLGPTGVGKTTTLAKLAARYSIYQNERVGLITIDHYRIGAVEQLKTYSEIVDVPLEVAMSQKDLREALKRLEYCDRVLIDTAGRGTGNLMQLQEMAGYVRELPDSENYLVMSATTRWQDIKYISNSFHNLGFNRLIVTKIDETRSLGAVLNAIYFTGVPLVYLTNGQNVPDDLQVAREVNIPSRLVEVEAW